MIGTMTIKMAGRHPACHFSISSGCLKLMNKIFVKNENRFIRSQPGETLLEALRREGISARKATSMLEGMSVPDKNELLFGRGINYNDLPNRQKRGVGVAFEDISKEGYNPVKQEKELTVRRELRVNYDIPLGDEYRRYILKMLADAPDPV